MQVMSDSYLPGVPVASPAGIGARILVNERVSHCLLRTPVGFLVRPQ
jgi:hypothetical protein